MQVTNNIDSNAAAGRRWTLSIGARAPRRSHVSSASTVFPCIAGWLWPANPTAWPPSRNPARHHACLPTNFVASMTCCKKAHRATVGRTVCGPVRAWVSSFAGTSASPSTTTMSAASCVPVSIGRRRSRVAGLANATTQRSSFGRYIAFRVSSRPPASAVPISCFSMNRGTC